MNKSGLFDPVSHESAALHVTGAALYTDDLVPRYPSILHAWPVQVPCAHAAITELNVEVARSAEGVVDILTEEAIGTGVNNIGPARLDEPLFPSAVTYHGQAVAWVLAETEEQAKHAAQLVEVRYEARPAILSIQDAIAANSFHTEPARIERGDVERELSACTHVVRGQLEVGGQEHFYLETQAAIAYRDEGGSVVVQSSTQHPTETQLIVSRVLGRPSNEIIVQSLRMGGAFGGKEVQANQFAAVAALGSERTGRPVRVRLDRMRDFILTGKRHPFLGTYRIGFDDSGTVVAFDLELYSDGGWSLDLSSPVLSRALFHADNAYFIEHMRVVGRVCKTHVCSHTAFRGFGGPQGMVMVEDALDRVARTLGKTPHEIRERNFYRPGHTTHYGQPVSQAERIARIHEELLLESDYESRWKAVEAFNREHEDRKRGLAITPVKFGISFTARHYNQAGALILIYRDGSVQVNHGGTEMGQGLHTKMRQVAAHTLGIPLSSVRIMPTRTDKVPNTSATAASSGSDLNGAAVRAACLQLRGRLAPVAAEMLQCPSEAVRFVEGRVLGQSPEHEVSFAQVVERAYMDRVALSATGFYRTPDIHYDAERGRGKPFHYFAYGSAACEVEVDRFTGMYELRRVDIVHDVGDSLSPLVDRGQIEGGFVQGVGWLTQEELWWNPEGRLGTANASTYKLPSLSETPEIFNVRMLSSAREPGVVYGSKAVGEPPFMLAMSVREALRQAVAAFGNPHQIVELRSPATAEQVYWAIESVRNESKQQSAAAE